MAGHESEKMLKEFDKTVRELFDKFGIEYARVFARSSNIFYHNYELYVRKDQVPLARLLIVKAKNEVDYDDPKWYRNIIFDDKVLKMLFELFPEREIKTDYDAFKLVNEFGENFLAELHKRMKRKENKK